ncbi:hypothetical protein GX51_05602 [Blastomyces parvus]|uniref:Uncharacterized protein n=1 Tax=Blastomyces parvus TaxID=2060905 RepID=A0A2B7WVW4_9EURO|nr:hypothetical protein GX51_05602 [Blastomyces parvus]
MPGHDSYSACLEQMVLLTSLSGAPSPNTASTALPQLSSSKTIVPSPGLLPNCFARSFPGGEDECKDPSAIRLWQKYKQ